MYAILSSSLTTYSLQDPAHEGLVGAFWASLNRSAEGESEI
jgi:hypothetical protein